MSDLRYLHAGLDDWVVRYKSQLCTGDVSPRAEL